MRSPGFSARRRFTGFSITMHCSEISLPYYDPVAGCMHNVEEDRTSRNYGSACEHSACRWSSRPGLGSFLSRGFSPMQRVRKPDCARLDSKRFARTWRQLRPLFLPLRSSKDTSVRSYSTAISNCCRVSYCEKHLCKHSPTVAARKIRRGLLITLG